jgi:phosphatidate cytidylyltransferase
MLKQRILTALLLIPPVAAAVWFLSTDWIVALFGVVGLLAAREWVRLSGRGNGGERWVFLLVIAMLIAGFWWSRSMAIQTGILLLSLLWWTWMIRWVLVYPRGFNAHFPAPWLQLGGGLVVIPAAIVAVALLHAGEQGALRVLFLFVLIWAADAGAYFAGRAFGSRKLAPNVSPGKTWEGAAGGLALAAVVVWIAGQWLFRAQGADWLWLYLLCFVVVALSIVGDLAESILKRHAGVKDSGQLLPGHGGMLDRVDSLLAAAPALALGLQWLEL